MRSLSTTARLISTTFHFSGLDRQWKPWKVDRRYDREGTGAHHGSLYRGMQIPMRLSLFPVVFNAKLPPTTWNDFIPAFSLNSLRRHMHAEARALRDRWRFRWRNVSREGVVNCRSKTELVCANWNSPRANSFAIRAEWSHDAIERENSSHDRRIRFYSFEVFNYF